METKNSEVFRTPKSMFQQKISDIMKDDPTKNLILDIFELQMFKSADKDNKSLIMVELYNLLGFEKFVEVVELLGGKTIKFPARDEFKELIETAKVFNLSGFQTLRSVHIPALRPHLVSAATAGFGFAWKSCVAAEVIASSKLSIGRAIYECKIYLEIPELFAWTAAIVIMSIALEKLMLALLNSSKKRAGHAQIRREKP